MRIGELENKLRHWVLLLVHILVYGFRDTSMVHLALSRCNGRNRLPLGRLSVFTSARRMIPVKNLELQLSECTVAPKKPGQTLRTIY